ncbi:DUF1499 domain-containing protein [Parvularcula maris]|uniref:DUF1499 domain-containing protein n=1 Tax=Parvularcula maris TaxID=2965077 RepID=A0A9X2L987_9PROT|nr:DUF1499 domain-containing protein [Parvularcula maris]MCQ8185263.1 DUF1499 domain-containing protein [Parvularcula maris]
MKAWPRIATMIALLIVLGFISLIYGYRFGFWGLGPVFTGLRPPFLFLLGVAFVLAAAAAGALVFKRSFVPAIAALAVAIAAGGFGYLPLWMKSQVEANPFIHDVTTDVTDPPAFVAVLDERRDAPNPPEYDREQTAAQLEGFPDLRPLVMPKPLPEAFAIAVDAVKAEGLTIKAVEPKDRRIEATETVPLFGFKDDVVIRLRDAHGVATVIDIRSKSRVGGSDLGFNARRIRSLIDRMEEKGGRLEGPMPKDERKV